MPTRAEISYYLEDVPEDVQIENPSGRGKEHVVQLTNLLPDTLYSYAVVAIDDKADLSSEVIEGNLRTEKGPDLIAPKIQGVPAVVSFADTRAKIVWKTDEPADSRVEMIDSEGFLRSVSDPATVVEHTVEVTNLDPATTYNYVVQSRDMAGNTTASKPFSLTTL